MGNAVRINPNLIPSMEKQLLCATFLEAVIRFYENPDNIDKLPGSMTEKQKKDKVRNLLAALRAAEVIKTDSPNHQISNWILNK